MDTDDLMVTAVVWSECSASGANAPWVNVDEVRDRLTLAKSRSKKTKQLLEDALLAIEQLQDSVDSASQDWDTDW
jgi:hypothetical protein